MSLALGPSVRQFAERVARRAHDVASTMSVEVVSLVSLSVIFPLTIRGLGAELYGMYTVLYVIFGLAGLWVYAGPSAAVVQLILQLRNDSAELLALARRHVLMATVPVALVGTAIAVGLFGWRILVPAVLVLSVDFALTSLSNLNLAVVFAVEGVVRSSNVRLLQPVLRASGVAALALGDLITITALVCVNIAASGVLLLRSGRAVRRIDSTNAEEARPANGKELIRYSSLYAASMSTNAVQNEGEKFVLATTRPAAEVGQYAAAYRVVSMALVPLSALVVAANRWFMVRDEREGAQLTRAARLTLPTALYGAVAGVAIFIGRDLVQWVAGSQFDDVALISAWLCLLPLLHGLAELPPMGLLGLGRNRERMLMGLITSAVALVSYLALVPQFGWRGAVIGTYVSETAAIVAGWVLLVRFQRIADRTSQRLSPASGPAVRTSAGTAPPSAAPSETVR